MLCGPCCCLEGCLEVQTRSRLPTQPCRTRCAKRKAARSPLVAAPCRSKSTHHLHQSHLQQSPICSEGQHPHWQPKAAAHHHRLLQARHTQQCALPSTTQRPARSCNSGPAAAAAAIARGRPHGTAHTAAGGGALWQHGQRTWLALPRLAAAAAVQRQRACGQAVGAAHTGAAAPPACPARTQHVASSAALPHPGWATGAALNTTVFAAGYKVLRKGLSPAGVAHAWCLGTAVFSAFGTGGYVLVCLYFIVGTLVRAGSMGALFTRHVSQPAAPPGPRRVCPAAVRWPGQQHRTPRCTARRRRPQKSS